MSATSAISVTSPAQEQAWATRTLPPVEATAPGIWAIPIPVPGPLRYTLIYALELENGVALVDAGWPDEAAFTALRDGLAQIGSGLDQVRLLLLTHLHPDHYGLAPRLRAEFDVPVWAHPADVQILRAGYGQPCPETGLPMPGMPLFDSPDPPEGTGVRWLLDTAGVSEHDPVRRNDLYGPEVDALFALRIDRYFTDGERLALGPWELVVHWTPGHAPGHVCLELPAQRLLLAGDHVLPGISPNVSAFAAAYRDPLGDFIASLRSIRDLDVDEVLPGHQFRYRGLNVRVDELLAHHERRLTELSAAVDNRGAAPVAELASDLVWSRPFSEFDGHLRIAAMGETVAHLLQLRSRGRVVARPRTAGSEGRASEILWSASAPR